MLFISDSEQLNEDVLKQTDEEPYEGMFKLESVWFDALELDCCATIALFWL